MNYIEYQNPITEYNNEIIQRNYKLFNNKKMYNNITSYKEQHVKNKWKRKSKRILNFIGIYEHFLHELKTKKYYIRFWKNTVRKIKIAVIEQQIENMKMKYEEMKDKYYEDMKEFLYEEVKFNEEEEKKETSFYKNPYPCTPVELVNRGITEVFKNAAEEAVKDVDEKEKGQMIPVDYPKVIVIDESKTPDNDPYLKELRKNLYRPQEPEMPIKLIEVDEDYKMLESLVNSIKGKPEMLNYLEGLIKAAEDDKLDKELKKESQSEKFYYDFSRLGKRDTGIENCTG